MGQEHSVLISQRQKNFKGTATFKVTAEIKEGFTDLQGNRVLENTGVVNPNSPYRNTFNALGNTDNPDYYYNKTIYIDTIKPQAPTVEPVHTDSINGEKTDKNQPTELLNFCTNRKRILI